MNSRSTSGVSAQTQTGAFSGEWQERLWVDYLINPKESRTNKEDGDDVIQGLRAMPKTLPPKYFYDDRGSQLFEQICDLPEYYPTRTEAAILRDCAEAIARLTGPCELVELGSGSATKTRLLLDAYQSLNYPLDYLPIDVSPTILETSARDLLLTYPLLKVHGLVSTYELALQHLSLTHRHRRLICFLGSTLGNLNPDESDIFFDQVTQSLQPGDYFLLGVDLQKTRSQLEAAYNDSQGVTAAFNLNILRHLNQRFAGDFKVSQFEHWAFYNQAEQQIEMHLRSLGDQIAHLQTLNLTVELADGETIRSEISRKFDLATLQLQLQAKGLTTLEIWTDANHWFGLLLCQRNTFV